MIVAEGYFLMRFRLALFSALITFICGMVLNQTTAIKKPIKNHLQAMMVAVLLIVLVIKMFVYVVADY